MFEKYTAKRAKMKQMAYTLNKNDVAVNSWDKATGARVMFYFIDYKEE